MNGAGNDFIILNNLAEKLPESAFPSLARRLCERHLSIGADGLIVVDAAQDRGDYRMRFYNSDGSLGEMCGNGARCVCRYGYETGLAGEKQTVETTAGIVTGVRITERLYRVRLNDPTVVKLDCPVEAEGVAWPCSYVELGDPGIPHAVIPWAGLRKGANVNFYELLGKDTLYERTYERGVEDFTYACGTGTGSVVTVLTLQGKVSGKAVKVQMTGGELIIDAKRRGSRVERLFLTGPTNIVCKGQVTDEDLAI